MLLAVFAVFYVLLQSAAAAHAVQYGDLDHGHGGETCLLGHVVQRDGDADLPDLPMLLQPIGDVAEEPLAQSPSLASLTPATLRQRGPPLLQ
ncbi:hypothetical protein GCM10011342_11440 [Aquisalinus flavus]|uniref:Secreted protein n=2 Tax=Aquisalinus flavus TaxID=1526572 RepID=A0A8J2V196_9PROT|nr:hypothetical protein GCM10011342_11440 [Aquisalinus flavus]